VTTGAALAAPSTASASSTPGAPSTAPTAPAGKRAAHSTERAALEPLTKGKTTSSEPGPYRAPSPPLLELLGRPLRITADPHTDADDVWARVRDAMADTF
jgi:hypothetical protein